MAVYLPLKGPGASDPKAPAASGWAVADYDWTLDRAILAGNGWVGLRCDGLVVIDCDSFDALKLWFKENGESKATHIVRTPRGFHCYYEWSGEPLGPHTAIFGPGSQVDLRSGPGSYVVCPPTPGYAALDEDGMTAWNPEWWSGTKFREFHGEGWDHVPEGGRNDFLARIGGSLRAAGASRDRIAQCLAGMNTLLCAPPLKVDEVFAIARSVSRYEPDSDIEFLND